MTLVLIKDNVGDLSGIARYTANPENTRPPNLAVCELLFANLE